MDVRPKRVLILDDDPDIRTGLASYLQMLKFEAIPTSQWTEALDLVAHRAPDLILLDLHMPTLQGDTVLNFIRRQGHTLPVIVMSAHLTEEIMNELRLMGVQEFIRKPFHLKDFGALVQKALGLSGEVALHSFPSPEPQPVTGTALSSASSLPLPPAAPPTISARPQEAETPGEAPESRSRRRRKRRRSRKIPDFNIYVMVTWGCLIGALILILVAFLWNHFPYIRV